MSASISAAYVGLFEPGATATPTVAPQSSNASNSSHGSDSPAVVVTLSNDAVSYLQQNGSTSTVPATPSIAAQYQSWANTINDPNSSEDAKVAAYGAYMSYRAVTDNYYEHAWVMSSLDDQFSMETAKSTFMTQTLAQVENVYFGAENAYFDVNGRGPILDQKSFDSDITAAGNSLSGDAKAIYFINVNTEKEADPLVNDKPAAGQTAGGPTAAAVQAASGGTKQTVSSSAAPISASLDLIQGIVKMMDQTEQQADAIPKSRATVGLIEMQQNKVGS